MTVGSYRFWIGLGEAFETLLTAGWRKLLVALMSLWAVYQLAMAGALTVLGAGTILALAIVYNLSNLREHTIDPVRGSAERAPR